MPLPFRLEEGIYFEHNQLLLPWGAPLDFLEWVDTPRIAPDRLSWLAQQCFEGHWLLVEVLRNEYFNASGVLEIVHFERGTADPWGILETYSALFRQAIGPPTQVQVDAFRPVHTWLLDGVTITVGVGERFSDFSIFHIYKVQ